MSTGTPYIGTKISLVSKSEIRYEGILYSIDTKDAVVTLANVRSFGTEDREVPKKVPPREEVYEYIVFRGVDIKELHVCEVPEARNNQSLLPQDPAIIQSGGCSRLPSGYSHFHTPVPYPQPHNYGPYGGPYGGYPGGRPMPGPMQPHPGMMPGPMMPPRIPTPPPVQPMPMSRSHTPSPETVLPVASSSNTEEVKGGETQDKTMSQQGTQTIQAKRRTSRTSSRRSSEDKTEAAQERKKQDARDKETPKESAGANQSVEPQRQRQGGNRRTQGRRGNSSTRGSKPRTGGGPVKFEGEFDFESSNAKFNKEEVEEELQQKLHENLRITDEDENTTTNSPAENEVIHDQPQSPDNFYDGSKSFFDSISCEANDRDKNRRAHPSWQQERKVNMETFGVTGGMRRGGRGRGRGRGGYRGGRGGSRYQGRDDNNRGGRGNWRGGRGGYRSGRSKAWVDYPINGDDKLPVARNLANGPPMAGDGQATAQA